MKRKNIENIKKLEGPPKIIKLFSDKEIKDIIKLYNALPVTVNNKVQKIIKKRWLQKFNTSLDDLYKIKIREALGEIQMDNLQSDSGEDFLGLFHESFSPLKLHVDSGFGETDIIFKQVVTPLSSPGETVIFKNRWYDRSTSFTINKEELNFKPQIGQNERSNKHLGHEEFDKEIHKKYLSHIDIKNLRGMKVEYIYHWKLGETIIFDRSHIHCSSSNIINKKIDLTTFTKKKQNF